ncbi:hypothetical protein L3Q65_01090 (plasmid) [Amycolatopsis sp. FU40]|uniref:hypothetical protein n=1 Tax=Amycolatopsis sp. FU40 TaxID=2914159 RepID=UPI001F3D167F|nr:hypothetical protein [Amycolatopsis sp. FU40]UKD50921.1 hypothetical protein L3Q65_01090 [Amycolatopsis sp. FU40]
MIGRRLEYRGSVEDAYGLRFLVADDNHDIADRRLTLATYAGQTVLRGVRLSSVKPVPEGPRHRVRNAHGRVQVAQAEYHRQQLAQSMNQEITDAFSALGERIQNLIDRKRPVEAECELLQSERFVGIITHLQLQERVDELKLKIAGDDESWLP